LRWDARSGSISYRLDMAPENTTLHVAAIDLTARGASGKLIVEDNVVQLRDIRGEAYGGDVRMDADLDFRGDVSKLNFKRIEVKDVNLSNLPENWNIPAVIRKTASKGKLSGTARLEIAIGPGKPSPAAVETLLGLAGTALGDGRWHAALGVLAGFPHSEVQTRSEGKGRVVDPAVSDEPIEFDWKLGVPRRYRGAPAPPVSGAGPNASPWRGRGEEEEPRATAALTMLVAASVSMLQPPGTGAYPEVNVKIGQTAEKLIGGVNALLHEIVGAGSQFAGSLPKRIDTTPKPPGAPPNYLDINLKLKNVNLADFVKSLGVDLGVPVEGKLSFQVKASIPVDRAGDLKTYKMQGSVQVEELMLAGVRLGVVNGDMHYTSGVLELTSLTGRFGTAGKGVAAASSFRGIGKLQVAPLGDLTAQLDLDRIPLAEFVPFGGGKNAPGENTLGGTFSGQLVVRAPAAKLKSINAIEGDGKLTGDRLSAYGLTLDQASATVRLRDGVVSLPDLQGKLEGTPISGSGELRLADDYRFRARLDLKNWDLSSLQKLAAPQKEIPVLLAGSFSTSVDLKGALSPLQFGVSGDAGTTGLKVNAFQVSNVKFHWETDGKKLNLSDVDVWLYGGQATGSATLPLQSTAAGAVDLKLSKLDARQMVKDLAVPFSVEGQVDGRVKGMLPPAAENKPRTATVDLDVSAPKLRVQNIPAEQLRGKLDYKDGVLITSWRAKRWAGPSICKGKYPARGPQRKSPGKAGCAWRMPLCPASWTHPSCATPCRSRAGSTSSWITRTIRRTGCHAARARCGWPISS
jgi:hypothetical protein